MVGESVQCALESLKMERDRIESAIASLEGLISANGKAGSPTREASARASKAAGKIKGSEGKRKNAPRGLLKIRIREVLKKAGKVLAPVTLTEAVMKAGYPNKNKKTLYTAIFATAKKDPAIKKTEEGFSLK